MFNDYEKHFNEEARLVILAALLEEADYRLNDNLLAKVLQVYGINRGRDYVRNQLAWLEKNAGAVRLVKAGEAVIAEITEIGIDHVEKRTVLSGVMRPSASRS